MALLTAIMGLIWGIVAVLMASSSLVFLIGGATSFAFGVSPATGILLIVVGVGFEHESKRHQDLKNREQLGRMLRIIEQRADSGLPSE